MPPIPNVAALEERDRINRSRGIGASMMETAASYAPSPHAWELQSESFREEAKRKREDDRMGAPVNEWKKLLAVEMTEDIEPGSTQRPEVRQALSNMRERDYAPLEEVWFKKRQTTKYPPTGPAGPKPPDLIDPLEEETKVGKNRQAMGESIRSREVTNVVAQTFPTSQFPYTGQISDNFTRIRKSKGDDEARAYLRTIQNDPVKMQAIRKRDRYAATFIERNLEKAEYGPEEQGSSWYEFIDRERRPVHRPYEGEWSK